METRTKFLRDFECEVRAEQDDERGKYITGQPVVFDSMYDVAGIYGETIERGALDEAEKEVVKSTAKMLCEMKGTVFYSGHCTGEEAFYVMKDIMGDQLTALHSGERIL